MDNSKLSFMSVMDKIDELSERSKSVIDRINNKVYATKPRTGSTSLSPVDSGMQILQRKNSADWKDEATFDARMKKTNELSEEFEGMAVSSLATGERPALNVSYSVKSEADSKAQSPAKSTSSTLTPIPSPHKSDLESDEDEPTKATQPTSATCLESKTSSLENDIKPVLSATSIVSSQSSSSPESQVSPDQNKGMSPKVKEPSSSKSIDDMFADIFNNLQVLGGEEFQQYVPFLKKVQKRLHDTHDLVIKNSQLKIQLGIRSKQFQELHKDKFEQEVRQHSHAMKCIAMKNKGEEKALKSVLEGHAYLLGKTTEELLHVKEEFASLHKQLQSDLNDSTFVMKASQSCGNDVITGKNETQADHRDIRYTPVSYDEQTSHPIRSTPRDTGGFGGTSFIDIDSNSNINDVIEQCNMKLRENHMSYRELLEEHLETKRRLDSWIENYMTLKYQEEQSRRQLTDDLERSWKLNRDYQRQINSLSKSVIRLTNDVSEEREEMLKYRASLTTVCSDIGEMNNNVDMLSEAALNLSAKNEGRLHELASKVEEIKNSPSVKKRTPRKFSKTIFRLKRRQSEVNEAVTVKK